MKNRKGLLRDWKTLMTDNDLDLNDRKMLLRARKVVPMALFIPSEGKIRGGKGRMKGEKQGIS